MFIRFIKLIIWVGFITGLYFGIKYNEFAKEIRISEDKIIQIDQWHTLTKILSKEIWESNIYLKFFLKTKKFESGFPQAGKYSIKGWSTIGDIIDQLNNPQSIDIQITILEGWNIFDIDNALNQQGLLEKKSFIEYAENFPDTLISKYPFLSQASTLEGFLYPDTYKLNPNTLSPEVITKRMLDNFNDKIIKSNIIKDTSDIQTTIILASILQKEANTRDSLEELQIVSGIINKRLEEKWFLGLDATACYPYKMTSKECTPDFVNTVINDKNNYNLRINLGLPPTPISNPDINSIRAILNPQSSIYYYYIHDNTGKIHYAVDNVGHLKNVYQYLR